MPDNDLDVADLDNETGGEQKSNPARDYTRDLEKKNARLRDEAEVAKAKAAEADAIRKENLFLKAGVTNIESGVGKLLFNGYEGELTVDAIRAAASEVNLIPTSEQADVKAELAAITSTSAIASSAAGSVPPGVESAIRSAKTPQEVIALAQKAGSSISNEQPFGLTQL